MIACARRLALQNLLQQLQNRKVPQLTVVSLVRRRAGLAALFLVRHAVHAGRNRRDRDGRRHVPQPVRLGPWVGAAGLQDGHCWPATVPVLHGPVPDAVAALFLVRCVRRWDSSRCLQSLCGVRSSVARSHLIRVHGAIAGQCILRFDHYCGE